MTATEEVAGADEVTAAEEVAGADETGTVTVQPPGQLLIVRVVAF